jgi:hypothetical protein
MQDLFHSLHCLKKTHSRAPKLRTIRSRISIHEKSHDVDPVGIDLV